MNELIWADGYLVIEPVENQYGVISSAKFVKVTGRPPQMDGDQRAVKVRMQVPRAVFQPFATVDIRVPEGDVIMPVVEVGV